MYLEKKTLPDLAQFCPSGAFIFLKENLATLPKLPLSSTTSRGSSSSSDPHHHHGVSPVKAGDRIALVYPNNDPLNFLCSFYGCIMAGTVPVPVEVPVTRRDAGSQQIGFLLGQCGVSLALTSDACFKGLPKNSNGEVITFKVGG